ncbi:DUF2946 domain-containing protein [Herminiimonas sp. CN]|uniref:DUF2946 domain-containing protein n=1 Tax=Herminiimonas sp. CN TaxID=1349818 RepID=UPI0004742F97|nr:DUF2946 domain-containing protein [Herminiimonas sp. CN]
MRKFLKIKPLFIWIVCLAMLVNVLAPSVSHAVTAWSSVPASPMMEICTMTGVHSVAAMAGLPDGDHSGPGDAGDSPHCPFCLPHGNDSGLLPSAMPALPLLAGHDLFPQLFYHAPYRLYSWTAASPRGPPLAS